jgi:hypothetical protein
MIIIFRRLYNFFPHYRPHLEGPITIILIKVLQMYKKYFKDKNESVLPRDGAYAGSFDIIE